MPGGKSERAMAECLACGTVYASKEWADGTIQPIGRDGCHCGSENFQIVEGVTDTVFDDEEPTE
jgi:predicted  nucleic acid-binding Zn-ribbon protein